MTTYNRSKETQRICLGEIPGAERVSLSDELTQTLPWGTFKLDLYGSVLRFNPFSPNHSHSKEAFLNKNFFQEVLPFPQIHDFYQEYLAAARAKTLRKKFQFSIIPDKITPFAAQVVFYYSKATNSFWALLTRIG